MPVGTTAFSLVFCVPLFDQILGFFYRPIPLTQTKGGGLLCRGMVEQGGTAMEEYEGPDRYVGVDVPAVVGGRVRMSER